MFTLKMFGQDLLQVLSVVTIVAEASEPIVDLTHPDIAQVYNLSAQQAGSLLAAFLNRGAPPAASPSPSPAPSPSQVAVAPSAAEKPAASPGPGLHNVVPA